MRDLPSSEFLSECFDYCEITGTLTWRVRPMHHFQCERYMRTINSRNAGNKAGVVREGGYLVLTLLGNTWRVHRLIWKLVHGSDPKSLLDHVNGERSDNRLSNLREATYEENNWNSSSKSGSSTGLKGVTHLKNRNLKKAFTAKIRYEGTRFNLGYFYTAEEAHAAYTSAARINHGEFANFG